jgi:hypothetical protein
MSPRGGSTPRQTDWLTVSCNVTLTLTLTLTIQLVECMQFSWAVQGRLRRDGAVVELRVVTVQLLPSCVNKCKLPFHTPSTVILFKYDRLGSKPWLSVEVHWCFCLANDHQLQGRRLSRLRKQEASRNVSALPKYTAIQPKNRTFHNRRSEKLISNRSFALFVVQLTLLVTKSQMP